MESELSSASRGPGTDQACILDARNSVKALSHLTKRLELGIKAIGSTAAPLQ